MCKPQALKCISATIRFTHSKYLLWHSFHCVLFGDNAVIIGFSHMI
jgi:hypothetical protein